MLDDNISISFNIWILINKQTGSVPVNGQRILTLGSIFHLTLGIIDNDLCALSLGIENVVGERTGRILSPDIWYNVTGTRDVLSGDYGLYVDNVILEIFSNDIVINMDKSIRLGFPLTNAVGIDDFPIGQIGTINLYERALDLVEIKNLYYLYNVQYLLKNSVIYCRVSDFDKNTNKFQYHQHHTLSFHHLHLDLIIIIII
jgi:hypothetical protein